MDRNIKILFAIGLTLIIVLGVLIFFSLRGGGGIFSGGASGGSSGGRGGALPDTGGNGSFTGSDGSVGSTGPFTDEEKQKLVQLSQEPVIGAAVHKDGDRVLYFKRGVGHLYQTPFDGAGGETRVSNFTIQNIIDARWSAGKNYALITTSDNSSIKNLWLQLTATSTIKTGLFPSPLAAYAFSPSEEKLASFVQSGQSYSLVTSSPDGRGIKTVLTTPIPDYEIYWIQKNLLALKTKTSALAPSILETVSLPSGVASVLSSGDVGFDVVWDSGGATYLASRTGTRGGDVSLSLTSIRSTDQRIPVAFKTLAEKCIFSKKESGVIFCAVPRDLGRDPLPDAWWQGKTSFSDELWKLNPATGESSLLLEHGNFDIMNPFTSPNENFIFFVNKKDSSLWSLRLL